MEAAVAPLWDKGVKLEKYFIHAGLPVPLYHQSSRRAKDSGEILRCFAGPLVLVVSGESAYHRLELLHRDAAFLGAGHCFARCSDTCSAENFLGNQLVKEAERVKRAHVINVRGRIWQ